MRPQINIMIVAAGMLAMTGFSAHAAQPPDNRLDRAGGVRIGEEFSALRARSLWTAGGYSEVDPELDCEFYSGELLPQGVSMMVAGGKVIRFDLDDASEKGPFGIGVEDSEASTLKKLPRDVVIDQHHYGDEGDHYLTWRDPPKDLALRVETWEGKVTRMYWGRWEAVQYVEGCL